MKVAFAFLLLCVPASAQDLYRDLRRDAVDAAERVIDAIDDVQEELRKPHVVAWTADWCKNCRIAEPTLDLLEMRGVDVRRIDCTRRTPARTVNGEPDPVTALPTISLYLGHEKVDEIVGIPDYDYVVRVLQLGEPSGQNVIDHGEAGMRTCCCAGKRPEQCYCLEELRLGRRTTGCNCTGRLGSLHRVGADGPWPVGTYKRRLNPE